MRAEDAVAICEAIESGKKVVQVSLEAYPGSPEIRPAILVTAHIIAISPIEQPYRDLVAAAGPNVHPLWERQFG